MEDVCEELDDRGTLGVVGGEGQPELEDRVRVVSCGNGDQYTRAIHTASKDGPWWTKKTASQTMRLSGDGVTYMPNGQCPVCRREAYSRETAVRVSAGAGVSTFATLAVRVFCLRALDAAERSRVGEWTRPGSMTGDCQSRDAQFGIVQ